MLHLLLLSLPQIPDARGAPIQCTHAVQAYACFSPDGGGIVFQGNATGSGTCTRCGSTARGCGRS